MRFFRAKDRYSRLLDQLLSIRLMKEEARTVRRLLGRKSELDRLLSQGRAEEDDISELRGIYGQFQSRLAHYIKISRIVEEISKKFEQNRNHSSHEIVGQLRAVRQIIGKDLVELNEEIAQRIAFLSDGDIRAYVDAGPIIQVDKLNQLVNYFNSASRIRVIGKRVIILIFMVIVGIATLVITTPLINTFYNFIVQVSVDETVSQAAFYQNTGVKIYFANNKEVDILLFILTNIYQDQEFLKGCGLKRIFIKEMVLSGGSYTVLFDEIMLRRYPNNDQRFIINFFHEIGHCIHLGLSDKAHFEAKIKDRLPSSLRNFTEDIAEWYAERMLDIHSFYMRWGRFPSLSDIMQIHRLDMDAGQQQEFAALIRTFHQYGFFPKSFNVD